MGFFSQLFAKPNPPETQAADSEKAQETTSINVDLIPKSSVGKTALSEISLINPQTKSPTETVSEAKTQAQTQHEVSEGSPAKSKEPSLQVAEPQNAHAGQAQMSAPAQQAPAPESTSNASTATQINNQASLLMTKEDIIAAYKIFLKRPPESMDVVMPRVGLSADRVLIEFFSSAEFLARPEAVKLIFTLAKKILDENNATGNADSKAVDASQVASDLPNPDVQSSPAKA